ncbi:MAG: CRTAC1 family protein [Pseudomonadota bacterium]
MHEDCNPLEQPPRCRGLLAVFGVISCALLAGGCGSSVSGGEQTAIDPVAVQPDPPSDPGTGDPDPTPPSDPAPSDPPPPVPPPPPAPPPVTPPVTPPPTGQLPSDQLPADPPLAVAPTVFVVSADHPQASDDNDGVTLPFATLERGLRDLVPGDTLLIEGSATPYRARRGSFILANSGAPDALITIQGSGTLPVIDAGKSAADPDRPVVGLQLDCVSHVAIRFLEIRNSNDAGISTSLDGCATEDITVENTLIHHVYGTDAVGGIRLANVSGVENALMSGAAYNADGVAEASMGLTAGDFDADGDEDLFMTHLNGQTNTLYRNDGSGNFTDVTDRLGLGASSLKFTGFGSAWFDYDNDAELDILIVNGAVLAEDSQTATLAYPYRQRNQLFKGAGGGRFKDVSREAGPAFEVEAVGRGAAFGDIDNDGDIDVMVSNNSGPLRLLRNTRGNDNSWLSVKLVGAGNAPHAVGARAAVSTSDGTVRWRRVHTDGSYLCASDDRLHFGLADAEGTVDLTVHWPSGTVETWAGLPVNSRHTLTEGQGNSKGEPVD